MHGQSRGTQRLRTQVNNRRESARPRRNAAAYVLVGSDPFPAGGQPFGHEGLSNVLTARVCGERRRGVSEMSHQRAGWPGGIQTLVLESTPKTIPANKCRSKPGVKGSHHSLVSQHHIAFTMH